MTPEECFPYRNPDGTPAFWHYQKDIIEKTLDALNRGKRCVVVDAPVGSGKSVINYTILKCLGRSVYVTAQKSLQDQIDNEGWPGVKSVKGRNAYTCNMALNRGINHSCDISFDDVGIDTCREKTKYEYNFTDNMYRSMVDSILNTIDQTKDSKSDRRARTSFADAKELFKVIEDLQVDENPKATFMKQFGCNIRPVECPVKSARLMAAYADIAVVNPDAYYILNKTMNLFVGREYMVVDEAHRLDDAIQRMFRIKIPLGIFNDCVGINLNDIAAISGIEEFCLAFQDKLKKEIWPIVCAIKTINEYEDCFAVTNMESHNRSNLGMDIDSKISQGVRCFGSGSGFSLLDVAIDAVSGVETMKTIDPRYDSFKPFFDMIRTRYLEECESKGCSNDVSINMFINKMGRYIKKIDRTIEPMDSSENRWVYSQKHGYIKAQQKLVEHIIDIKDSIEKIVYVIDGMVRSKLGENRVFAKELIKTTKEAACNRELYPFYKELGCNGSDNEVVLDIIPLHIGCLLQNLIFKDIKSVIMSSGTWPHPSSTIIGYGFRKNDIEVLRIAPLFPAANRPIFINTNPSWTDFSKKIDGGMGYVYQSEIGARKFCSELYKLCSYIRQKHGANVNIAVHCANYSISKLIAEYYPALDDKYLLHLPRVKEITNKLNGYTVFRQEKDVIISRFCDNPASGLTIISPSILEGLDFKEDICRAQIILKAPIPNLGDAYCRYKFYGLEEIGLKPDKYFLDVKCAIDLSQAYGRVVRGMTDKGETYMMDLALSKRMAKACGVTIDGMDMDAPGDMGKLNILYIKQGIRCSSDEYGRLKFKWI